jgi:hypothetical protein
LCLFSGGGGSKNLFYFLVRVVSFRADIDSAGQSQWEDNFDRDDYREAG